MVHLITTLLKIPQNVWVEKFENRSTFGEDIDKRLRLTFGATLYFNTIKMNIRQNTKHLRYDTIQEFNA